MKTIIKAILRFFKYSKLSFIGLFLLIFFSSATFTTLNNTSVNLQSSYSRISKDGNLHEFVINENYKYGDFYYLLNTSNGEPNGTIDIIDITSINNTSYKILLQLNKELANNPSSEFYWTDGYNKILNSNIEGLEKFLNFSLIVESSTQVTLENWKNNIDFIDKVNIELTNKKLDFEKFFSNNIQKLYINDLENKFDVTVESFDSINISNTKQNIFYKVVEMTENKTIDNLVLYDGNNFSNSWLIKEQIENSYNQIDYEQNINLSRTLVPYLYNAKWSSDKNNHNNFLELYEYTKYNQNYNPYTNENGNETIPSNVSKQSRILKKIIDSKGISSKGYSLTFSYRTTASIPVSGYIEDKSSYEVIVSPDYLKKTNKKIIDFDEWQKIKNYGQEEFDNWLRSLSDDYKLFIDNQEFVILGTGITPDLMYPIISFSNVVPDPNKEQIVYVNKSGYYKINDAFRGSEKEKFLVGKSNTNVDLNNLLNEINEFNKNYMSWPDNIKSAFKYNDISNNLSPTALRLEFIPKVLLSITVVSAFLTTFTVLLSVFISVVIIQRFIQTNRNSLGIMQANGYKKREIIVGICTLISIPVSIATILGYIIGFSVQSKILVLLQNFWTIPTSIEPFSLMVMLPMLFVTILSFILITSIFSYFSLRGETSEFMKDDAKYKMKKLSVWIKKHFTKFNIIIRFRATIAFASLWKILILSIMSAGLMMSLTFSLNVLNAFDNTAKATFGNKHYNYSLDLITPTLQSGQYYSVPYTHQGMTINREIYFNNTFIPDQSNGDLSLWISQNYEDSMYYKKYADKSSSSYNPIFGENLLNFGNYQLVSQEDSTDQDNVLNYLKYKTTTKSFTDVELGLGNLSTNPWKLASQLMPPNNANYANQSYKNLFENAVKSTELVNIGYKTTSKKNSIKINNILYEQKSYYEYIKSFSKIYAVLKDKDFTDEELEIINNYQHNISGVNSQDVIVESIENINNNFSAFYDEIDSISNPYYDYYFEFDNSKISGNEGSLIKNTVNIYFLNLLFEIYKNPIFKEYVYGINYGKINVGTGNDFHSSSYSYIDFQIEKINNYNFSDKVNFKITGTQLNDQRINLINLDNQDVTNKTWNINYEEENIYPVIVNAYFIEKYNTKIGDTISIVINNSADRYSRLYYGVENPKIKLKIVDVVGTYYGPEFYMNQYDVNKCLGLTINNVKPKVPTKKEDLKSYVNWEHLEYDNVTGKSNLEITLISKDKFIPSKSGFNGIYSVSDMDLKEVTTGVSLYSVSGIYPGVDVISSTNPIIDKIFTGKNKLENIKKLIETTGFYDLAVNKNTNIIDWNYALQNWKTIINEVEKTFGSSAYFSILNNANSINSLKNVFSTMGTTATEIQNIVLAMIIVITLIIVVIISAMTINDSMKLAAILKCLGMADRNNAISFLSVYFPVFLIGLILSIPFSYLITFLYIRIILDFSGLLLFVTPIWWYHLIAALGIIIVFSISYWTAWSKISKIDLTGSIK